MKITDGSDVASKLMHRSADEGSCYTSRPMSFVAFPFAYPLDGRGSVVFAGKPCIYAVQVSYIFTPCKDML